MEMKYLKYDKNTDWLAFQRKLPKALQEKAEQINIESPLVWPLGLTKADSPAKIAKAVDACNEKRDGFIAGTVLSEFINERYLNYIAGVESILIGAFTLVRT